MGLVFKRKSGMDVQPLEVIGLQAVLQSWELFDDM